MLLDPTAAKTNKRQILEALKADTAVMGAELANTRITLAVRTK